MFPCTRKSFVSLMLNSQLIRVGMAIPSLAPELNLADSIQLQLNGVSSPSGLMNVNILPTTAAP